MTMTLTSLVFSLLFWVAIYILVRWIRWEIAAYRQEQWAKKHFEQTEWFHRPFV